jgi:uncharacterized pyridoxal phosphate-containing UPF0001 family protein
MTAPTPPHRALLTTLDVPLVRTRLATLTSALAAVARTAGHDTPPEVLVASKYFAPQAIAPLVDAGAHLLGENRAEALAAKQAEVDAPPVQWDYIGELQSRKVPELVGHVSRIHTLASTSAVRKLQTLAGRGIALPTLLIQVNVAGEDGKGGIAPRDLPAFLDVAAGLPVRGLMTMPPLASDPDESRRWFAALRGLADAHGLPECSMGTSQDALAAAAEGATVVRIGGLLTSDAAWNRLFPND